MPFMKNTDPPTPDDIDKLLEQAQNAIDELQREDEIETLSADIEALKAKIDADTAEYKQRAADFASEVSSFNDCANTAGCFSQYEFNNRRAALLSEQADLDAKYNEIINTVETCNAKIEQYNNNVLRTNQYSEIINSNIERVEQ